MCTKSGAGLALEAMRLVPQSVGLARLAPACLVWLAVDPPAFPKDLRASANASANGYRQREVLDICSLLNIKILNI